MKCDSCSTPSYRLRSVGNGKWVCRNCLGYASQYVSVKTKIKVGGMWATQRQLDEMGRRKILPYEKPGGGYYLGRMGENGKIQEKAPDYSY